MRAQGRAHAASRRADFSRAALACASCLRCPPTVSIQAVAWAIEQQDVTEPVTRLTLICLANYAGADGNAACPSVLRLARDSGLSERAVRIHLRHLETAGLIVRGNPAFAAARIPRADRRPYVYNLVMSRGAPHAPRPLTGGTAELHGGHMTTERGAPRAPNPKDLSVGKPKSVDIDVSEAKKKATEEVRRLAERLRVTPSPSKRRTQ